MPDLAFMSRVAALLVAREADAGDLGKDAQRVLRRMAALVPVPDPRRLAADSVFADEVRNLILAAYAIPALARDLPDPSPILG